MTQEMLVNVAPHETRVALLEDGLLHELFVEANTQASYVGNIYCGKVVRVLPGMQAVFVEIGLARTGFLHLNDMDHGAAPTPVTIQSLLRVGQLLTVQVMKDPLGTKGARLTTRYSLSSHYLVYLPQANTLGVSQRIEAAEERERLRAVVAETASAQAIAGGFIVRTAAEAVSATLLQADIDVLVKQWRAVTTHSSPQVGQLRYHNMSLSQRVLRDYGQAALVRVWVDNASEAAALRQFAQRYIPDIVGTINEYQQAPPLFIHYGIEEDIQNALARRVDLNSGGYIIFDETEAMTTVDVNTGAYIGSQDLPTTAYQTNLEAATTIARQLRVRNLGGMIMIDFIDMPVAAHREHVNAVLDAALAQDRVKTARFTLPELGLVALTRKRSRESLAQLLQAPCPCCAGTGRQASVPAVVSSLARALSGLDATQNTDVVMAVASDVGAYLLADNSAALAPLAEAFTGAISVRIEPSYQRHQFDLVSV